MTGPLLESYVTARELAALMGVSERTVKRWVAAGIPSETWGMSRTRRFLPSEAIAWARSRSKLSDDNPPRWRANATQGPNHLEVP